MRPSLLLSLALLVLAGCQITPDRTPEVLILEAQDEAPDKQKAAEPAPTAKITATRQPADAVPAGGTDDWICSFEMWTQGSWRPGAAFALNTTTAKEAKEATEKSQKAAGIKIRGTTCSRESDAIKPQ